MAIECCAKTCNSWLVEETVVTGGAGLHPLGGIGAKIANVNAGNCDAPDGSVIVPTMVPKTRLCIGSDQSAKHCKEEGKPDEAPLRGLAKFICNELADTSVHQMM